MNQDVNYEYQVSKYLKQRRHGIDKTIFHCYNKDIINVHVLGPFNLNYILLHRFILIKTFSNSYR